MKRDLVAGGYVRASRRHRVMRSGAPLRRSTSVVPTLVDYHRAPDEATKEIPNLSNAELARQWQESWAKERP